MVFNTWDYVVFFVVVYALYLSLPRYQWQNWLLLVASYYFYAAWDWRFAVLMLASTIVDYVVGIQMYRCSRPAARKALLLVSMVFSLSMLGVFKYYNFFLDSLTALLAHFDLAPQAMHLDIILPFGISFYTFQTMSYTIDIYRGELVPTRNFRDFALFVAFFPHLVAGPIMRAADLIPQFTRPRSLNQPQFAIACWLIGWGLWKKIFVADNMALMANHVFSHSTSVTWLEAYLGVVAFAFQIYCDFSAYSDIARGCAQLLGIQLVQNFNLPYFATNPSDFWRRWHISFSTWLRDYLYIPLGGNRYGTLLTYRNLLVTMVLGGLWHGASWNFIWWGTYHGCLLSGHRLLTRNRTEQAQEPSPWGHFWSIVLMSQFTLFGWLLFRSTRKSMYQGRTIDESFQQIMEMLTSYQNGFGFNTTSAALFGNILFFSWILLLVQWFQYRTKDPYCMLTWPLPVRAGLYGALAMTWMLWGIQSGATFIYFQF